MKRILSTLSQKWPEYLLEILVITIGILGAFALNNWNEDRKSQQEAQELYQQLLLDYESNLKQLNQKIELHRACVNSGFFVLNAMDKQQANLDTLLIHISVQSIDVTFDPIKNDLSNSGKINLISDQELNRLVSNWSSDLAALREMELMWQGRVYGQFLSLLMEMGIERDVQSKFWEIENIHTDWLLDREVVEFQPMKKSRTPPNVHEILENKQLESIVSHGVVMNQGAIEQSLALKTRIERTISLLKEKIES
ncbi:DUF6090 family protein [Ekhidna sp.]|uniref:DUF6090 family protein n=1 Tax=Ekhidna sp. TaxID=2608089 RepID=UPI0032F03E1F